MLHVGLKMLCTCRISHHQLCLQVVVVIIGCCTSLGFLEIGLKNTELHEPHLCSVSGAVFSLEEWFPHSRTQSALNINSIHVIQSNAAWVRLRGVVFFLGTARGALISV